ncbi:hypothetical protein GE09DRAFT_1223152 [Coniochaeta sp. 2T2.1]|nr:hypothetical protein GE09DRAFT_1223152 [Coniochaeta sp. 2T2.1]
MAGSYDGTDDGKCMHYARFAAHLDRHHFDMIYWVLFVIVIFMLFAASWRYGRSIDAVQDLTPGSLEHKRKMQRCMLVCSVYAVISVVAVVMEVFALMALQFCDGEDLMSLYWSTWTVMQIGSLIAIFGVLLAVFHTIRGRKHPPWALALGTPVLVVAGLGHIIQGALHKKVKSVRGRGSIRRSRLGPSSGDLGGMSTSETIAEDEEKDIESEYNYTARLLGYTPDGATIVQLCESTAPHIGALLSPMAQANIIGTNTNGEVIFTLSDGKPIDGKPTTTTTTNTAKCQPPPGPNPGAPGSSTPRRSATSVRMQTPPPIVRKEGPTPAGSVRGLRRGSDSIMGSSLPGTGTTTTLTSPTAAVAVGSGILPTAVGATRSDSPGSCEGGSPTSPTMRGAMSA